VEGEEGSLIFFFLSELFDLYLYLPLENETCSVGEGGDANAGINFTSY
jgi:hypothetical protein